MTIDEAVQDLREARHLVWSATECNKEENWDNYMKPETQLCAGYSSGNIASCYVSIENSVKILSIL